MRQRQAAPAGRWVGGCRSILQLGTFEAVLQRAIEAPLRRYRHPQHRAPSPRADFSILKHEGHADSVRARHRPRRQRRQGSGHGASAAKARANSSANVPSARTRSSLLSRAAAPGDPPALPNYLSQRSVLTCGVQQIFDWSTVTPSPPHLPSQYSTSLGLALMKYAPWSGVGATRSGGNSSSNRNSKSNRRLKRSGGNAVLFETALVLVIATGIATVMVMALVVAIVTDTWEHDNSNRHWEYWRILKEY